MAVSRGLGMQMSVLMDMTQQGPLNVQILRMQTWKLQFTLASWYNHST